MQLVQRLMDASLRFKFNFVLIAVFVVGLAVVGFSSWQLLHRNARAETMRSARLLMDTALAIRSYTVSQVGPPVARYAPGHVFLPQTVPAFAATQALAELRQKYPEYGYKEATLNPTNPANRASEWETDVVKSFRTAGATNELVGERDTSAGRSLYIAHPIRVSQEACLVCHSTPQNAPQAMIAAYGPVNGFGWQLNEVIGAQIVSVPTTVPVASANRVFIIFMTSLVAVFALLFVILNLMLTRLILQPVQQMASAADAVSSGDFSVSEMDASGKDEISVLGTSFNRMRRSLEKAMKMLEG